MAAVAACAKRLHRYPDGAGFDLRTALAERYGLGLDQVCLGNGSNELIEMCCRAFLRPGDNAVAAQYAFLMYGKLAAVGLVEPRTSSTLAAFLDGGLDNLLKFLGAYALAVFI